MHNCLRVFFLNKNPMQYFSFFLFFLKHSIVVMKLCPGAKLLKFEIWLHIYQWYVLEQVI